jgi:hypothetical protein
MGFQAQLAENNRVAMGIFVSSASATMKKGALARIRLRESLVSSAAKA